MFHALAREFPEAVFLQVLVQFSVGVKFSLGSRLPPGPGSLYLYVIWYMPAIQVDVDECDETAAKCEVEAMPTFQFFKNGQRVLQVTGADEDQLRQGLERLL